MKLAVRTIGNRVIEVDLPPKALVAELKERLAAEHGYDLASAKIIVEGASPADDVTVEQLAAKPRVVFVAKKKTIKAKQEEQKREREEQPKPEPQVPKDAPPGPLNAQQLSRLTQLQDMMDGKVRSMRDFVDILQYHGTVTDIRTMVQADQNTLAPILHQINFSAPKLLAAINQYQTEFLSILNEPVPVRPMTGETEDADAADYRVVGDFMDPYMLQPPPGHEVVYFTREDDEAIQRGHEVVYITREDDEAIQRSIATTAMYPAAVTTPRAMPVQPEVVTTTTTMMTETKAERKARRKREKEAKQAEDYKYLKEHRIHVVYEQLVRQLLQERPDQPVPCMLKYLQQQGDKVDDTLKKGR